MTMTIEQAQKIRLLSDDKLYCDAVDFVTRHDPSVISQTQLNGLWNAVGAGDWQEIVRYIDNRLGRDTISDELWELYQALKNDLNGLLKQVEEIQLVVKPERLMGAEKKQVNEEIRWYAYLLAKEFIQHLVAEYNYQRSLSNA